MKLIEPHGGKLVSREVTGPQRDVLIEAASGMARLELSPRSVSDLELIAVGAYSPLEGFMGEADYHAVVSGMRLKNGVAWSIPITLPVSNEQAQRLREGTDVALYQGEHLLGVLHLTEKFPYDKQTEARSVYGTTEDAHPGVRVLYEQGNWLLGGRISLLNRPGDPSFVQYRRDPAQTRALFRERGWLFFFSSRRRHTRSLRDWSSDVCSSD